MSVSETPSPRRFTLPADYYSSPTPAPRAPKGLVFGCGAASLVALLGVFAGGAFLSGGGMYTLMDFVISTTRGEMRGQYTADVTAAQKDALDEELDTLLENLRAKKIAITSLDPTLQAMRGASIDQKLTHDEVDAIVAAAKKANATAKK